MTRRVVIDYGKTFSAVVKSATIHTVLSLAVSYSWKIHQFNVKNVFLHGKLEGTVFMHQTYAFRDQRFLDHVCCFKWSLYGLNSLGINASLTLFSGFTYFYFSTIIKMYETSAKVLIQNKSILTIEHDFWFNNE
ncbi:putative RNA-directed DNA polymerase [Helianthus annuus]|nr:putative RNA-directed DNA polymerase [Helianthus annuus]